MSTSTNRILFTKAEAATILGFSVRWLEMQIAARTGAQAGEAASMKLALKARDYLLQHGGDLAHGTMAVRRDPGRDWLLEDFDIENHLDASTLELITNLGIAATVTWTKVWSRGDGLYTARYWYILKPQLFDWFYYAREEDRGQRLLELQSIVAARKPAQGEAAP